MQPGRATTPPPPVSWWTTWPTTLSTPSRCGRWQRRTPPLLLGPMCRGPAASATHFLEAPTAATAVEGGIPNQTIALGQRRVLDLSFFFVDGKGVGAIDGYHVNVSPSDAPVFARISSAALLTLIGLQQGVAVVEATAIDGYDSNGSGDVADDDPSLNIIVTVRGES